MNQSLRRPGRPRRRVLLLRSLPLLSLLLGSVAGGCGGDMVVELDTPLLISETYPASGASVPLAGLEQLEVVFTEDLGARAASSSEVRSHFAVDVSTDGATWTPVALAAFGYQAEERTVVLTIGAEATSQLAPRWEVRLRVTAGLEAESGQLLPRDRLFFFRVADPV